jgi:glycosyltransferase involved in cell wall biosynthesis
LRVPHVTTRRGVAFHRRGLALARKHAALVIVPSVFTRGELVREGFDEERLQVVPFGVDPPQPRAPDEIDAVVARAGVQGPFVLTVGTVEPRKDVTTIVNAVERLRRSHPDLTLVVAGPRGWGEVRGLDRSFVRVLGAQPWNVIDALYRRAAVFCVASLYEGFGLPAVEAMARGTPTVATMGSAVDEVVRGAGVLFPPGDADRCAVELARALDDDALRAQLDRDGRARAATLTWQRSAEAHARAYARAVTHATS